MLLLNLAKGRPEKAISMVIKVNKKGSGFLFLRWQVEIGKTWYVVLKGKVVKWQRLTLHLEINT